MVDAANNELVSVPQEQTLDSRGGGVEPYREQASSEFHYKEWDGLSREELDKQIRETLMKKGYSFDQQLIISQIMTMESGWAQKWHAHKIGDTWIRRRRGEEVEMDPSEIALLEEKISRVANGTPEMQDNIIARYLYARQEVGGMAPFVPNDTRARFARNNPEVTHVLIAASIARESESWGATIYAAPQINDRDEKWGLEQRALYHGFLVSRGLADALPVISDLK